MAWISSLKQKQRMDLENNNVYRPPYNNTEQDKILGSNIENAYLLN